MRESILKRLKYIFDKTNFLRGGGNCVVDSIIRIEDDNFDRCTSDCDCYFYYNAGEVAYIKLCSSLIEEDLREVR